MYYTNAEGLLNTYPPLAVIVFVINVKWFTEIDSKRNQ